MYAHVSAMTVMRGTWTPGPAEDLSRVYSNLTAANATECGLDICVQRYNGTVDRNIFTEKLLDAFTNVSDIDPSITRTRPLYVTPPADWASSTHGGNTTYAISSQALNALIQVLSGQTGQYLWEGWVSNDGVGAVDPSNDLMAYMNLLNETQIDGMFAR